MAEIAVLRKHIVNYARTRDAYAAYRKAGYSKKFLAKHECEIMLHKAAKQYFDELGVKKLPTVKALNTEYATLMVKKKAAYDSPINSGRNRERRFAMGTSKLVAMIAAAVVGVGAAITGVVLYRKNRIY